MINTDCQDTVPRDFINRRPIFIRVPSCSGFPVLVSFAQQILHLRLDQWLSVGRTCNLRNILKNHVANRMPRSCGTKKPKINCKNVWQNQHCTRKFWRTTCRQEDTRAWSTYHPKEADLGMGFGRTAQPSSARPGDLAYSTPGEATPCYPLLLKTLWQARTSHKGAQRMPHRTGTVAHCCKAL